MMLVRRLSMLCVCLLLVAAAPSRVDLTTIAFGGGGDVNPVTPPTVTPPGSVVPGAGALVPSGPHRVVVLKVVSLTRRLVVVRDLGGRLIGLAFTGDRGLLVIGDIPASGALIDVLGTDAIGIPVLPGQVLTIVAP